MLGERVNAEKAAEWGLINGIFKPEELPAATEAIAARLAEGPTLSYAGTKRQLNAWLYGPLEDQLELEAAVQQEMAASDDFVEGVTAFFEKRRPNYGSR